MEYSNFEWNSNIIIWGVYVYLVISCFSISEFLISQYYFTQYQSWVAITRIEYYFCTYKYLCTPCLLIQTFQTLYYFRYSTNSTWNSTISTSSRGTVEKLKSWKPAKKKLKASSILKKAESQKLKLYFWRF